MLRWVLLIVTLIVLVVYLIQIYGHDPIPPRSGEKDITFELNEYGFGPEKRLLIFDLTKIGSVENIHDTDKDFATLTWSDTSGNQTSTIGIELKGAGFEQRQKLNLAFEFWEAAEDGIPCTSIETCDDDKKEMFDFGEDYEDYVLRGGWHEQTFVRDYIASELHGGILQKALVEVIFKIEDRYTYEGVYLLFPTIQRRVLEKRLDWDSKGKKEDCDDEDYNIEKVSLIIEHTIESMGRKEPCSIFEDYSVKMRYPKCDFYDEEAIVPCRDQYMNRTNHFASVLTWKNETPVALDLDSFANNYLAEMLMREDDFPYTSQYFYVDPDHSVLHSGPRWDYDRAYWRVATYDSWNLINLGYYNQGPMQLWRQLGKGQAFIDLVKSKKQIIQNNKEIAINITETRKKQFDDKLFDKELNRWGMFGKKREANYIIYIVHGAYSKSTPQLELDKMKEIFTTRSDWMQNNIGTFDGFEVSNNSQVTSLIIVLLFPIILVIITTGYWIYYALNRKRSRYRRIDM